MNLQGTGSVLCLPVAGVSVLLLSGPTVSADPQVSLEIPALPVVAGSDVTLRCRSKDQVAPEAFFIRDGSKLGSGPEGQFTIRNVQPSDEGLYWCYFDQTEESPRRRLSVRGNSDPSPGLKSGFWPTVHFHQPPPYSDSLKLAFQD
ncbi:advanced glycosylation end product-specific receptor-like [Micropterus dolomieu]|uniref:advanced glycosylation end product-specific receptor-like n=1 Tax=Micropterus dolomieu TaxID=147949 RepID=UPI001E8EADE7|nr:advanced glycosylation end product-specific receptor-like [Micropterus dolomieu]